jgi:hypothetical protein
MNSNNLTKYASALFLSALALVVIVSISSAQVPVPCIYYGTVKLDGESIPEEIQVSAWISETEWIAQRWTEGGESWYGIEIPYDNPATPQRDGGAPGDVITFKIGDVQADQTALWQEGLQQHDYVLSLTASHLSLKLYPSFCPLILKR